MHQIEGTQEELLGALGNLRGRILLVEKVLDLLLQVEQLELLVELGVSSLPKVYDEFIGLLVIALHHIEHQEEEAALRLIHCPVVFL
jgi:hypothetical protein